MLRSCFVLFAVLISVITPCKTRADDKNLMQSNIKHVVIVMMENRSFDNTLAWLYDVTNPPEHFIPENNDHAFLGLSEDTLDQYTNVLRNSKNEIVFSCAPIKGVPSVYSTPFLNSPKFDPNEPFPNVQMQMYGLEGANEPTMLGFLQDYGMLWEEESQWKSFQKDICAVMETYTDKELPFMYGMARHYAVSDYWFSSVPTQTNPNRAFSFCGTSEGEIVNGHLGKNLFQSKTIWNCLAEESPSTTWSIFWQADMLHGIYSGPYSGLNTFAKLKDIPNLNDHFQTIDRFHEQARKGQLPEISFVEPDWTISIDISPKSKESLNSMKNEDFIIGYQGNDLHPPGDIRSGEDFLANIYTSLTSNKEAWNQTLLIITFDEHGGLFDHVIPPKAIAPDDSFQHGFKFDRYGVRVPTIFISPLVQKGTIIRSSDPLMPFDHTSLIATILNWKNIDKSKWNLGKRVDAAPTFENVITLTQPREDSQIGFESSISNGNAEPVQFGDSFYLRSSDGNYLCTSRPKSFHFATAGSSEDKVRFEFTGGTGQLTHGAFSLIKSHDTDLEDENLLEAVPSQIACKFTAEKHKACQWWNIKSKDHPFLNSNICYGDRLYIEQHIHNEFFHLVASRLSFTEEYFGKDLRLKPIIDQDSEDHYWTIEKAEVK